MTDLEIKISAPGADQATRDLAGVGRAGQSIGEGVRGSKAAIEEGGDALDQFGRRGGEARHAIEGVDQLMRGSFQGGILGGARVLYVLREAFSSTTAFVSVGIGVLGAAVAKLYEVWQEAKAEEIKASADAAATHMEQLQKAIEETDAADLKAITAEVQRFKDEADLATAALKALSAERLKLAEAEGALKIEQIKNNPNLTEEQKVSQIAGVEQGTRDQKRKIEIEDRVQQEQQAVAAQSKAQAEAQAAAADKAAKDAAARAAEGAVLESKRAPDQLAAAKAERDRIGADIHSHGGYTRDFPSFGAAEAEVERQRRLGSPEELARRESQAKIAAKQKEDADREAERTAKALEEANKARGLLDANNSPEVSATRILAQNSEDAAAAEKTKAELKKAQEEDRKKELEKQKRAAEQDLSDYAGRVDQGVGKVAHKPEEAAAVAHVREAAQRIGADGATAAAGEALFKEITKLAEASAAKDTAVAQHLVNSAIAVNALTERLRQIEQQLRLKGGF